jgi:hypothetical protein
LQSGKLSVSFTPNVSAIFGVLDMKTEANVANGVGSVGENQKCARQLFDHWLFKECNVGTRRHLWATFGLPIEEIRNHCDERHALRYVLKQIDGTATLPTRLHPREVV